MPKSNIQKKTKNYLTFLKILTKWLGNKRRNTEYIKPLIDKYNVDNSIMRRILSYLIGTPHIHWYCNKYLNNKYKFDQINTIDLIFSLVYMMDINKCNDPKKFYFLKTSEMKDNLRYPFKKLLREYFETIENQYYNDLELNFLYKLFTMNEITHDDISKIDILINNKNTLKLDQDVTSTKKQNQEIDINKALPNISDNILQFICDIQNEKTQNCKNCPLINRPMVVFDTNADNIGDIDIMFIGLNPGKEEGEQNRPFVGDSGKEIRKIIAQFPDHIKWGITNFILCCTDNKKELEKLCGSVSSVQNNCSHFLGKILQSFPAKYYVAVGSDSWDRFNISSEKISKISGKIYNIQMFSPAKLIPIIHPSSVLRSRNRYQGIFDKSSQTIIDLFKNQETVQQNVVDNHEKNNNIVHEITDDMTFFDVRELSNNKILLIYIQNGIKKYMIKDYTFEFYVKTQNWQNTNIINANMDYKISVNGNRKHQITKMVREYLNDIKRS